MAVLGFTSCSKDENEATLEYVFVLQSKVHAMDSTHESPLQAKLTKAYQQAGFDAQLQLILTGKSEAEIQDQFVNLINRMEDELGISDYPILGEITVKGAPRQDLPLVSIDQWKLWYVKYIDDPYFKGGKLFL